MARNLAVLLLIVAVAPSVAVRNRFSEASNLDVGRAQGPASSKRTQFTTWELVGPGDCMNSEGTPGKASGRAPSAARRLSYHTKRTASPTECNTLCDEDEKCTAYAIGDRDDFECWLLFVLEPVASGADEGNVNCFKKVKKQDDAAEASRGQDDQGEAGTENGAGGAEIPEVDTFADAESGDEGTETFASATSDDGAPTEPVDAGSKASTTTVPVPTTTTTTVPAATTTTTVPEATTTTTVPAATTTTTVPEATTTTTVPAATTTTTPQAPPTTTAPAPTMTPTTTKPNGAGARACISTAISLWMLISYALLHRAV